METNEDQKIWIKKSDYKKIQINMSKIQNQPKNSEKGQENGQQYNNAMTGCSDCQVYALRQILKEVSRKQEDPLIKSFYQKNCSLSPTEHHLGFLLSPLSQKSRNYYGVYFPNLLKHRQLLFPQGLRPKKRTNSKKYIAKNNIIFLQQRINFSSEMILENELSIQIIPYFVMIKSYLKIAIIQQIPIKLCIKYFVGNNLKNLSFTDIELYYSVKDGKYVSCQINQRKKKMLIYECVCYKGQIQIGSAVDKICNLTQDQQKIECHPNNDINHQLLLQYFNKQIDEFGGLQKLILSDAAAHKQFAGLKDAKTDEESFERALQVISKIDDPNFTAQQFMQYRRLADQIGCSKKNPKFCFIVHVLAAQSY